MPKSARRIPLGDGGSTLQPLDDVETAALDALADAFAVLYVTTPLAPLTDVPADLVASLFREPLPLVEAIRALARTLTGRVLGAAGAADTAELDAARQAVERARVEAFDGREPEPIPPAAREEALPSVAELIREVGLEEFDASVILGTGRDGRHHLAWHGVPPETALIWLQGRLFDRIEAVVLSDRLLELERIASRWVFDRWSLPLRLGDRQAEAFTRDVREREWSLVERETVTFSQPLLHTFCDHPVFEDVPARQQRLARALRGSFVGVFSIAARRGDDVEFEDPLDGRRFRVHEHNREVLYDPGFTAIGRLIPLGEGRWLRSPGMVIFKVRDEDAAREYASGFAQVSDLAPALVAEGLLAAIAGRGKVPRSVPAADSPAEAKALLEALNEELEERGWLEQVTAEEVPPELRAPAGEERLYYSYDVDDDMAAWIAALGEQARRLRGRRGGGPRRAARAKGKRRGKRR